MMNVQRIMRPAVLLTLAVATAFTVTGCGHVPGGLAPSTTPLEGRKYDNLGYVSQTDSRVKLLGILPMSGANSLREAVADAIAEKKADALINVTVDYYSTYWILWSSEITQVEGDAIKFK